MNDGRATDHFSMQNVSTGKRRPVTTTLDRRIYATVVGLAVWLILSVWLFAGAGVMDYLLFVVSGFIAIVVSLILILSRVGRTAATRQGDLPSLREWARWDFEIGQGGDRSRLSSVQAATQILLPITAVAFGMTLFGVVMLVVEHVSA
jgi:hypothetical protein